jgi:hypothetical protein
VPVIMDPDHSLFSQKVLQKKFKVLGKFTTAFKDNMFLRSHKIEEFGSWSPKKLQILRIRIGNTAGTIFFWVL